jgi:hypothetical protein
MPDLERPDAKSVVVKHSTTTDPEAAVKNTLAAGKPPGMLTATGLAGLDGKSALIYEQWSEKPGNQQEDAVEYHLYRSLTRPDKITPGCVVIVTAEFDGIDPKTWVDAVFDALETDEKPAEGGLSAHFHISTDGKRALNYAEWTSEAAHVAALENSGQGTVGLGEKWRKVKEFPGLTGGGFTRFRLLDES